MNVLQLTLHKKLVELKAKNPRLSDRYFAQKLGLSSGALSEILKGKRQISLKLAEKLAQRLQLEPSEREHFLRAFAQKVKLDVKSVQLQDDQFHMISDWVHFAILNLIKSKTCQHKPAWLAQQLQLPVKTVHEALERMLRLGLLERREGKYHRTKAHLHTSDDVMSLSIRKSNVQDLELISEQLEAFGLHERDLTSMTLLLDPAKMPAFKKWLRQSQDRFAAKFETTDSETAFRLTMALFPLKKPAPKGKK